MTVRRKCQPGDMPTSTRLMLQFVFYHFTASYNIGYLAAALRIPFCRSMHRLFARQK
jgi:hypothetical protein